MLKYQSALVKSSCLLFAYLVLQLNSSAWSEEIVFIVNVLPLYVLVSFGAYTLGTIGYNLVKVKDCPEAAKEIELQIKQARDDLKSKNFQF